MIKLNKLWLIEISRFIKEEDEESKEEALYKSTIIEIPNEISKIKKSVYETHKNHLESEDEEVVFNGSQFKSELNKTDEEANNKTSRRELF